MEKNHKEAFSHLETELPESPAYRSPLLSDSEPETASGSSRHHVLEAFVGSSDEPSLRNKLLTNLVNKRSESDGIVCLDRPRPELQVRRCESVDNAIDLVDRDSVERIPEPPTVHFPQGIKTVTPATIMKGPEDYAGGQDETAAVDFTIAGFRNTSDTANSFSTNADVRHVSGQTRSIHHLGTTNYEIEAHSESSISSVSGSDAPLSRGGRAGRPPVARNTLAP